MAAEGGGVAEITTGAPDPSRIKPLFWAFSRVQLGSEVSCAGSPGLSLSHTNPLAMLPSISTNRHLTINFPGFAPGLVPTIAIATTTSRGSSGDTATSAATDQAQELSERDLSIFEQSCRIICHFTFSIVNYF